MAGLFVRAVRNSRPKKRAPAKALDLRANWHDIVIDPGHLDAFNTMCGVDTPTEVSLLYPITFAYPLMLRMLSDRAAPMPLFYVLNTHMRIEQHRPLAPTDRLNLDLAAVEVRRTEKGLELEIQSTLRCGRDQVWTCVMVFFYRGHFGGPLHAAPRDALAEIEGEVSRQGWTIPAKGAFRFGTLCGDTNPLHYGKLYAKAFGFERDFAQPLLVLGQALTRAPVKPTPLPVRLEARLKAPVYYERPVHMLAAQTPQGCRFDIYCAPNDRPSICACIE
jgi:hypothetical protein